ncbi:MAG: hypothetical protein QXE64_00715 [Candidatus Pacearchaeota archaeon]
MITLEKIIEKVTKKIIPLTLALSLVPGCTKWVLVERNTKEIPTENYSYKVENKSQFKEREVVTNYETKFDNITGLLSISAFHEFYETEYEKVTKRKYQTIELKTTRIERYENVPFIIGCSIAAGIGMAFFILPGILIGLGICEPEHKRLHERREIIEDIKHEERKTDETKIEKNPISEKYLVKYEPVANAKFELYSDALGFKTELTTNNKGEARVELTSKTSDYIVKYGDFTKREAVSMFSSLCLGRAYEKLNNVPVELIIVDKAKNTKKALNINVKSGKISDIKNALREAKCY